VVGGVFYFQPTKEGLMDSLIVMAGFGVLMAALTLFDLWME